MIINQLYENLDEYKNTFFCAKPFPHLVLDEFIDPSFFSDLTKILKDNKIVLGKHFNSTVETNKGISLNTALPEKLKEIINYLNSESWVENLINTSQNSFVTEQGDIENWKSSNSKQKELLENVQEYTKRLQEHIK